MLIGYICLYSRTIIETTAAYKREQESTHRITPSAFYKKHYWKLRFINVIHCLYFLSPQWWILKLIFTLIVCIDKEINACSEDKKNIKTYAVI